MEMCFFLCVLLFAVNILTLPAHTVDYNTLYMFQVGGNQLSDSCLKGSFGGFLSPAAHVVLCKSSSWPQSADSGTRLCFHVCLVSFSWLPFCGGLTRSCDTVRPFLMVKTFLSLSLQQQSVCVQGGGWRVGWVCMGEFVE